MATISLTDPVAGTVATAGQQAGNNAALRTAINGGLDSTNIASLTWAKLAVNRGTAFPGSPVDGEQYVYTADATNGVEWTFKYNSGSASAYKWEFVGGSPMFASVATSQTTASAVFTDLVTVGPSIALPRTGDYEIVFSLWLGSSVAGNAAIVTPTATGLAASDANAAVNFNAQVASANNIVIATGISGTLKLQYRQNTAGTLTAQDRNMFIRPIRVS